VLLTRPKKLPYPPREERKLLILIIYEEYCMLLPYCSLHERLFLSSRNEWMDFSQENIHRVKDLSLLPPSSDLAFSQLKVLEGVCDRCREIVYKPPFFFFILLLFAFGLGLSVTISYIFHWFIDS
jgi:hypothetical protein